MVVFLPLVLGSCLVPLLGVPALKVNRASPVLGVRAGPKMGSGLHPKRGPGDSLFCGPQNIFLVTGCLGSVRSLHTCNMPRLHAAQRRSLCS